MRLYFCLLMCFYVRLTHAAETCLPIHLSKLESYSHNIQKISLSPESSLEFKDDVIKLWGGSQKVIEIDEIQKVVETIKGTLFNRGYLKNSVTFCLKRDGAKSEDTELVLRIDAGARAGVSNITIMGLRDISTKEVENVLASQKASFITESFGTQGPDLKEDKTRILNLLRSRGYVDAHIAEARIEASEDLSECNLIFRIDEGSHYRVGEIRPEVWKSQISLRSGESFNMPRLESDVENILIQTKDQGFPSAKAVPRFVIEQDKLYVSYELEPGKKTSIRSIRVKGNVATHERVIKLWFTHLLGEQYSYSETEIARQNLLEQGAFSDAKVQVENIQEGYCDLLVIVTEKFPILFKLSPYYLAGEGFLVSGYIVHQNLLGLGVYALFAVQLSALRQTFDFLLYEPHLAGKNVSLMSEIHNRQFGYSSFSSRSLGGGGKINFRLNDKIAIGLAAKIDEVTVEPKEPLLAFQGWAEIPQSDTISTAALSARYKPFGTNKDVIPLTVDLKVAYSGPVTLSEFDFIETSVWVRVGLPIFEGVIRGQFQFSQIAPTGQMAVPLSERYFLGGQGNLRGYQSFSVGPYIRTTGGEHKIQIGGVIRSLQTIEVEYPFWKRLEMKGYLFTDFGNAFAENGSFSYAPIAASVGFGLKANLWSFPLKCEIAFPIVDMPGALPFDLYFGFSSQTL